MAEIWNAGDKVRLTGSQWDPGELGLAVGDIVTLVRPALVFDGSWEIAEGDVEMNGGPIMVWPQSGDPTYAADWGAVLHEPASLGNEVRTTSSTGGQKGVKPESFDLVPWDAMDEVARVYNFGATKYAAHNWRKGYEWSKSFAAACRHLFAFWRGQDRDEETGTLHLANAIFHLLALIVFVQDRETYGDFDDRYKGSEDEE